MHDVARRKEFSWTKSAEDFLREIWDQRSTLSAADISTMFGERFGHAPSAQAIKTKAAKLGLPAGLFINRRFVLSRNVRELIARELARGTERKEITAKAMALSGYTRDRIKKIISREFSTLRHSTAKTIEKPPCDEYLMLGPGHYAVDERSFELIRAAA